jgi:hypothetical protein
MPPQGLLAVVTANPEILGEANSSDEIYGSSLPPLTLVIVTLPLFRSVDVMVWEVGFPLSVCHVLVVIFFPSDVTSVLCSSFMLIPPVSWFALRANIAETLPVSLISE